MLRHGGTKSSRCANEKESLRFHLGRNSYRLITLECYFHNSIEFYKLMARNDIQETKEQLVSRYVGGLRLVIHDEVEMHRLWKIHDAYQLASKVEAKLSCGGAWKYAEVCSFYPPSKMKLLKEETTVRIFQRTPQLAKVGRPKWEGS
ncbi:hypothetical protein AMTRI_Chr03g145650 [Amborella trichopoda]